MISISTVVRIDLEVYLRTDSRTRRSGMRAATMTFGRRAIFCRSLLSIPKMSRCMIEKGSNERSVKAGVFKRKRDNAV